MHADALLQNMIRAELERQRAELRRETQRAQESQKAASPPPKYYGSTAPPAPKHSGSAAPRAATTPRAASEYPQAEVSSPPPTALVAQAVAAARAGDAAGLADLIRRLNAIHAAHPRLLNDARIAQLRVDVAQANDGREDRVTTRKLMDRERAVAEEMKRLASGRVRLSRRGVRSPGEPR